MIPAILQQPPEPSAQTLVQRDDTWAHVARNAAQALDAHPHFRGRTNTIRIECRRDTLILTGRLPSFYLKQLLQEALRGVDGVGRIDNHVAVICCDGLGSTLRQ